MQQRRWLGSPHSCALLPNRSPSSGTKLILYHRAAALQAQSSSRAVSPPGLLDDHLSAALAGQPGSALQGSIKTGVCHCKSPAAPFAVRPNHLITASSSGLQRAPTAKLSAVLVSAIMRDSSMPMGMGMAAAATYRRAASNTECHCLSLAPRAVGSETMCRLSFSLCRISSPRTLAEPGTWRECEPGCPLQHPCPRKALVRAPPRLDPG